MSEQFDIQQFCKALIIQCPGMATAYETDLLINSYSKIELAQICLICLEVIRERNKQIEDLKNANQ